MTLSHAIKSTKTNDYRSCSYVLRNIVQNSAGRSLFIMQGNICNNINKVFKFLDQNGSIWEIPIVIIDVVVVLLAKFVTS